VALRLFAESPVVGTGPGTWVVQRISQTQPGEFDDYIPHAHNIYAQTLAELGVVGAVAGVVLLVMLARLLLRAARGHNADRRRWAFATAIGLTYFGTHHLFDFYVNEPSILFALALPIAYLEATDMREATRQRWVSSARVRSGANLAAIGVVLVAVLGLAVQEVPALKAADAVARADAGDWAVADAPAREAAAADPGISPYLFTAGLTAAHNGDHAAAVGYFRIVAERDDLPEAWLNLAAEALAAGDRADVAPALRAALRLGIRRTSIAIPAGALALRAGEQPLGIETLITAVVTAPSFLADPWWELDTEATAVRAEVAERAAAAAPGSAWEISLMTGDVARARELAGSPDVAHFVDAWAGDDDAKARLEAEAQARPFDTQLLGWCARLERRRGNEPAANRFLYLAETTSPGSAALGRDVRVVDPSAVDSPDPSLAVFWAPFTYRRFVPRDMLVPSLLHLA